MKHTTWLAAMTGVCCLLITLTWTLAVPRQNLGLGADFTAYYGAASALRQSGGAQIYHLTTIAAFGAKAGCTAITPYAYPPLFAILLIPLTYVPCGAALVLWDALGSGLVGGSLWVMNRIWPQRLEHFALFCIGALLLAPTWVGFWWGQVHALVLFALVWSLWRVERDDHLGAGIALALISWIQVIPGLLVVYLALRHKWKAVATTLVTGALLLVAMVGVVGVPGLLNWVSSISAVARFGDQPSNISPAHLLGGWIVVPIVLVYLFAAQKGTFAQGYLWTVSTMLALSPLTYDFYLLWLLPAGFALWGSTRRRAAIFALIAVMDVAVYVVRPLMAAIIVGAWCAQGWQTYRVAMHVGARQSDPAAETRAG